MPAAVDITDPFRALSDPTRRQMVDLLAQGPLPVRMIASHFPSISRPAVSKHLRVLREGSLVTEERSGRERFYRLEIETLQSTLAWMVEVDTSASAARPAARPAAGSTRRPKKAESKARSTKRPTRRSTRGAHRKKKPVERPTQDASDWKAW